MAPTQEVGAAVVELTEEMRQAIATSGTEPLWFIDPQTKQTYVLLRKEVYDLVKRPLGEDDGLDGIDVGALMDAAMSEDDENDPILESYQEHTSPQNPGSAGG
jgi:hypothetical protein